MNREQEALVKVLRAAILNIRLLGYKGQSQGLSKSEFDLVADLADAVHNIPDALMNTEFDLNFHTNIMLGAFSQKYAGKYNFDPLMLYEHYLNGGK